jgi:hypothetical protein
MKQSDFFIKSCLAFFQITVLATFYIYSAYLANADEHTVGAALKLKMKYLAQNQAVISKNLANANTPGYKAIELKEPQYNVGKAQGIGLATTSPMHINGRGGIGGSFMKLLLMAIMFPLRNRW